VFPCQHYICQKCCTRWIQKKHIECPMCRQTICFTSNSNYSLEKNFVLHLDKNTRAGLTIKNCKRGCMITKIVKSDEAYLSGLRIGYVIVSVNGISCTDIESCNLAKLFTQASLSHIDCYCKIYMSRSKKIQCKFNAFANLIAKVCRVSKTKT